MANYYPPVGFHFKVEFLGLPPSADDTRFAEVGGLSVEMTTEEVPEGGENRFVQRYPVRAKYPELSLKRGLLVSSEVREWIRQCVEDLAITPLDLNVSLLNEERNPLLIWRVVQAFPTKWSVSDLNAGANAIVVESMQLAYQYFKVERP
ncbi:MAG: phage tail protein [Phycisphaerales bacterium]